ncbi:unnamed protein product [Nippostrongylus brasiliensis]|uniref:Uncharacterized protein n=1 Tax=Nippostrongylus brasiliensis TaxID=27835 RepID=A0A0N4XRQ0_NIPBR|nr:unnamed protein product [Nippostrongylus brasiliensis]
MNGTRILNVSDILSLSPPKVIACTRIERPVLNTTMLPTIESGRFVPKTYKSALDSSTFSTTSSVTQNGIEKKPRTFASAMKRNTRRTTGARRKKTVKALPGKRKVLRRPLGITYGKNCRFTKWLTTAGRTSDSCSGPQITPIGKVQRY